MFNFIYLFLFKFFFFFFKQVVVFRGLCVFSQCGVALQDVAVHPSASSVPVTARAPTACCFQ